MKPVLLGLGLFLAFLLVRSTLKVGAQGMVERPGAAKISAQDTRSRRVAALEAQELTLASRQHEVELELDRIAEGQRKLQNRMEREASGTDLAESGAGPADAAAQSVQLLQKKAELRQELDRIAAERQRLQEDWHALTGMRMPAR